MGSLVYDQTVLAEIDDRTLAHVEDVVVNKLRRQEAFALSLNDADAVISVWISPQTPLQFVSVGNRHPVLNRQWLEDLADTANSISQQPLRQPGKVFSTWESKG
jgi:hypothetical protein